MLGGEQRPAGGGLGGFVPVGRRAEDGAEQAAGAGLAPGPSAAAWGIRPSPSGT